MSGEERVRADIHKLSQDLARGLGGTTVLIEQASTNIAALGARLDQHTRETHTRDLSVNRELGELKAQLASIDKMLNSAQNLSERVAKLETGQEHVRADITGKHDIASELAKSTIESADKKDVRELEREKLKLAADHEKEKLKISSEHRQAQFRFWAAIAVVALPGLIALFWRLLGLPGTPPTIPSPHGESP